MPTLEEWGRLQIVVGGEDVTFFRDVPCKPLRWSFNEPFSDATAEILFPQISGFEEPPAFLQADHDAPNVDIWLIRPDDSQKVLWEGMVGSFDVSNDGLTIVCIGALYQLDLYKQPPSFRTDLRDTQEVIAEVFTSKPGMRTGPPAYVIGSGLTTRQRGGWTRGLTGYVQDLLTQAEFPEGENPDGTQLTLLKEAGRTPSLGLKDMVSVHWRCSFGAPGVDIRLTRDRLSETNVYYGEGIDNADHCRWRNTVYDEDGGAGSYFAPLVSDPEVIPEDASFDPMKPRIEDYTNYGEGIDLAQGIDTASRRYLRENPAGWHGTITLTADVEQGAEGTAESRFEMRINENIVVENFQGSSVQLHIVQVAVDMEALSVTLTVDTKARDAMTLAQIIQKRAADALDPAKRYRQYRNSRNVEDRIQVFDCEAGGGVVPATSLSAGQWTVIQVPFGEAGELVRTDLTASPASRFSVAVFDQPISAAVITAQMPNGPLENDANDKNPWDVWPDDTLPPLVIAWGGPDSGDNAGAAGYWPGSKTSDPITGRLVDDATWSYATPTPPWLWVALWAESSTSISGRFYPGVERFS